MTFCEQLNGYLSRLDATYSRLAKEAGLSASTVSGYVKGEREPAFDSEALRKTANGLYRIAQRKHLTISEDEILDTLQASLKNTLRIDYDSYIFNINTMIRTLDIRVTALARALSFDASHISKILSGQRRPGHITDFTQKVAAFIAQNYCREQDKKALGELMQVPQERLMTSRDIRETVAAWLGTNTGGKNDDPLAHFLDRLNDFNLNEFINTIHFNDIKLPTAPFQLPTTKTYFGIKEMMESEIDFIKATVLSRSTDPCILYSDMPLEEMAKDPEFPKKYMFGLAMLLKKGLRLNMIHDINRPFHEMMLGLEGNIPLYMTGQISPYYLSQSQGGVFNHLLKVSGAAALEGNAIAGHQADGRYTLYKSKDDVRHFRRRAEELLTHAKPLMDIYRSDRKKEYSKVMFASWQSGDRKISCCSLPIYTISDQLLDRILQRNGINAEKAEQIRVFRQMYRKTAEHLLENYHVTLSVPQPNEERFGESPLNLALSEMFFDTDVPYTYEEYTEHLQQTKTFAASRSNLSLECDPSPTFRNINYSIISDRQVVVSKNQYPTIHFVIHHKKMVKAFCDFVPPIRESDPEKK